MSIFRWKQCKLDNDYYVECVVSGESDFNVVEQVDYETALRVYKEVVEKLKNEKSDYIEFDSEHHKNKKLSVRKSYIVKVTIRNSDDD